MTAELTTLAADLGDAEQLHQPSNLPHAPLAVDAAQVPLAGGTDPAYGEVRWRTLINGSDDAPRDMVLGIAEFGPGGRLLPHRHDPAEFYFGLEGTGMVTIDGIPHEIRPGVAIYVPGGAEHGTVAGRDGLRFAYGFAAPSFEQIQYRFSAQA
ncbi:cupin domain-containing protein [Leisingera daeponensis]|uniref:Cupin domain-containing protein n=1 Tax=Leisingera daeponensis TaxID=405746 RepID=A0ABS7NLF2_9RHOB|nr:cupin domain-containing protein [Leisingera daeponensis]MBY6141667.1 cupin domain-containing protein [Leisingera daeponensis]